MLLTHLEKQSMLYFSYQSMETSVNVFLTVNVPYLTQGSRVQFGHYWNLKLLQFCESIQPFIRDNLSYCPWTIDLGIISRYIRTTSNPFGWAPWTKVRIEQLFYPMLSLYLLCLPKFVSHVFQPITIEIWNIVSLPLCPRIPCHHLLLDTSLKSVDQHGYIDF